MKRIAVIGGTGMKQLVADADFGNTGYVSATDSLVAQTDYGDVPLEVMTLNGQSELSEVRFSSFTVITEMAKQHRLT